MGAKLSHHFREEYLAKRAVCHRDHEHREPGKYRTDQRLDPQVGIFQFFIYAQV